MSECKLCKHGIGTTVEFNNIQIECFRCKHEHHYGRGVLEYTEDAEKAHLLRFHTPDHVICPNCGARIIWTSKRCGRDGLGNLFSKVKEAVAIGEPIEWEQAEIDVK